MITYKNIGQSTKTFYGVTFKPGDIKEVPGYINGQGMARIFKSTEAAKVSKKRGGYNRKPTPASSTSVDSASITSNNEENNIKEENT